MDISALVNRLILLFFTMAVGFLAAKGGILDVNANKAISKLVVNVTNPIQILASVLTAEHLLNNWQVLELMGLSLACFALTIAAGLALPRMLRTPKQDARVYQFMLSFSNIGFLGYPLVTALLGEGAAFYVTPFVLMFQLVCWSYGVFLLSGETRFHLSFDLLRRPCVISALLACAIYLSGLRLPALFGEAMDYTGTITSQLAMLVIGCSLAQLHAKTIFGNWRIYVLCLCKLVLLPLLIWVLLRGVLSELMLSVLILVQAMPVATNTTLICYEYGANDEVGSSGVFLSTLLSAVTLPLLMALLFR